jgi:DNA replication protein DnaC
MEWLMPDVAPGHPRWNQIVPCDLCGKADQQARYLERLSGLSPEMRGWSLAALSRTPARVPALEAAAALVAQPQRFYTLVGPNGTGKSHILAGIVNGGLELRMSAVYTSTAALLDHLRTAYAKDAPVSFDGLWDNVVTARILALDEFDRWNPTLWAQEKFFELIDERYRQGERMATCFATNRPLSDLPQYVTSRMQDRRCHVFELAGLDMRKVRP